MKDEHPSFCVEFKQTPIEMTNMFRTTILIESKQIDTIVFSKKFMKFLDDFLYNEKQTKK